MRTDQLIQAMAADRERPWPVAALLSAAILAAALAVAMVGLPVLGMRDDLGRALMRGPVAVKQAFPLLLALAAAGAALRLACPGRPLGPWLSLLAIVPAVLALLVAATLAAVPSADWMPAMMGQSSGACLLSIGLMSVPLVAAALWALRGGADTRLALSGALAGLLGGSVATAIYALHCTEDSPLFFAFWYMLGILGATAVGALLGPRLLRW